MAKSVVHDLIQIFKSSVSAVLPENLIRRTVKFSPANQQLTVAGENYNLQNKHVYLLGTGKAVQKMAREVENILTDKIKQGIISIPEGSLTCTETNKNVQYYEGAKNNLPDKYSEKTSRKVKDLVSKLGSDDLLLVLISGGGSALLSLPKEPITLEEKTELIKKLGNAGADIKELNTVRKKLSDLKGGQIAIKAQPAKVVSLILSDIVGDPLDLIASGPTVENTDGTSEAKCIIDKYKLFDGLPESIKTVLQQSCDPTPFPKGDVKNHIIGSNKLSLIKARKEAKKLNYITLELSNIVTGNVKDLAKEYVKATKAFSDYLSGELNKDALRLQIQSLNIPGINVDLKYVSKDKDLCIILGGETTVEVKGSGMGGRNQQLALEFSKYINNLKGHLNNLDVYFLSAGTDGIDGPTDAAGAVGYLDLITDSKKENLDVCKYLENNDSYNFYKNFKNGRLHVVTGHTNTNVMDIHVIIINRSKRME